MKLNKKFLSILLISTLCFTACGQNSTSSAPSITEDTSVESITETSNETSNENSVSTSISEETTSTSETIETSIETSTETSAEEDENKVITLRDTFSEKYDCRIGCAVTGSEVDDSKVWDILTTHFNAVTLGNELKPDCMFGYSNGTVPSPHTVDFNGEQLLVPTMNYSRANKILNKILEWNNENPDRQIKVRGHVLVWHSQTPEWFFHEDYDKNKAYVDKNTMNKRLEWYISSVLTYYTGSDSKYKDLFYGWDVVNEAVSDNGGYRTDNENPSEKLSNDTHGSNSSWWHVYGSNEYIINAFKYANKYAPADLELYYNDYNECNGNKQNSIAELLTAVKDAEGEPGVGTRISAMGMQGHYGIDSNNPSSESISSAIRKYCKIVGAVQLTEVDLKISSAYDTSEEGIAEMNETLRKRYNMLLFAIKSATFDDYVNLTGLTFWGTVDKYSWLQSRSNVGGGNTTSIPQMPLLFDDNYEPKSCFYVFAQ